MLEALKALYHCIAAQLLCHAQQKQWRQQSNVFNKLLIKSKTGANKINAAQQIVTVVLDAVDAGAEAAPQVPHY